MEGKELIRVIPIIHAFNLGGARITVVSLEKYDDGSILRARARNLRPPSPPERSVFERLRAATDEGRAEEAGRLLAEIQGEFSRFFMNTFVLKVGDNLGTAYESSPPGGRGGAELWEGDFYITPPIPEGVHSLTVTARGKRQTPNEYMGLPETAPSEFEEHTFDVDIG
jgi:hypothetical protein